AAFAAELVNVRRTTGLGVGVTTHDGLRSVAAKWAETLGPAGCWASPQVYDHTLDASLDRPAQVVATWARHPWPILPSVGVLRAPDDHRDHARERAYFEKLPRYRASVLWYDTDDLPTGSYEATL